MQKSAGGLFCHASITVGGPCDHAFKEAKDSPHTTNSVHGCDKVQLRCPWVSKTDVNTAGDQRSHQTFRAVHDLLFSVVFAQVDQSKSKLSDVFDWGSAPQPT